jgi:hypothetical protein
MSNLTIRRPVIADLGLALRDAAEVHVAVPTLLSLATVVIMTNVLTALAAVGVTTYLNLLFLRLSKPAE